ncbi:MULTISPECIES: arginine ABC transporter permease ArtQ [Oceanimonas]|uniref:ABC transporter n=1 Tax=Oceanimonas doudoroffii TaxID=84158 RepID=A0A233RJJ7_9GAMM|nr:MULTISPECIES: arginine ABC transporter permease ArtQ [Oceanimonas]NHH99846.1 Arginine ABC transporter permease protein ArtQ [Oceanimonas sp. MB9]OXY83565.1 ABC transporter [Oceanimonas doudoroffii]
MMTHLFNAGLMTLGLALVSLVVGMVLAMLFCGAEMSRWRLLRLPASALTTVLRGLPEILVVFFIYFGSTHLLFLLTGEYIEFSPFWCGVTALSLLFAAYGAQTLRGALNAVSRGQRQAALALGLPPLYSFFRIVLPQAWRHALPGLGNQWLVLLKDTALVSLIGVHDLMHQAKTAAASTYEPFTWYASAALIYLAITLISQQGLKRLQARVTRYD